jgi:phosphopantothenate-cysteine ligase/phosphopantothenoylcysteine decarboxylase/phosphopantothenate--cysteine ligase
MHILVTAGNTQAPIDKVRCVTNVFSGRTGAAIALHARRRGHTVTLLTSHPEAADAMHGDEDLTRGWTVRRYRTFDDLHERMAELIPGGGCDAVVHCAAVSDYLSAGVYGLADGTTFDAKTCRWHGAAPALVDRAAAKVKSDEAELWLRLVRAPKLVDKVRKEWGFRGVLVKFKLEVGASDAELLEIAERSRRASDADLMAANTLETASLYAFLGPVDGAYQRVTRTDLAERLLEQVERRDAERSHG